MRGISRVTTVAATLFILGTLFTCMACDYLLIFKPHPIPDESYQRVERFYHTLINSPAGFKALFHAVIALDMVALATKLAFFTEEAVWFDGGSLFLMIVSLGFYLGVTIPSLQALFPYAPPQSASGNLLAYLVRPSHLYPPLSQADQRETLAVVGASNCICIAILIGVIALQISDWQIANQIESGELEGEPPAPASTAAEQQVKKDQ